MLGKISGGIFHLILLSLVHRVQMKAGWIDGEGWGERGGWGGSCCNSIAADMFMFILLAIRQTSRI